MNNLYGEILKTLNLFIRFLKKMISINKKYLINLFLSNDSIKKKELIIIGLGPGDPSLLTIAAVDAIKKSTLVAYPISNQGGKSIAAEIASNWIKNKPQIPLLFPMENNSDILRNAWNIAAEKLRSEIIKGNRVVFISQGDISLFSTGSYIMLTLASKFPELSIKLIPGVTSLSAASAIGRYPLIMQNEQLLISSVPDNPKEFEEIIIESFKYNRVIAFLKIGIRWVWVKSILEKKGLLHSSLFAQRVGFPDQIVLPASEISDDSKPYFSLLIVRKSWPLKSPEHLSIYL